MNRALGGGLDGALIVIAAGLAVLIVRAAALAPGGGDPTRAPALLARDPLDLPTLRDLGLRLDREGRLAEADAILSFVGRRTWRDGPTEVWLLRRRLNQGRYREGFESADALLRRDADGTTRPALFALLIAASDRPDARPALVARLAASPWWRGDFLRALGAGADAAGAAAVFAALARGPRPPAADEYAPLIDRLVGAGDNDEAYAAWRAVARPVPASTPPLHDGGFSGASDHTPFTWSEATGVGASEEIGPVIDSAASLRGAARALRIDYDGYSSPSLPAQLLVRPPRRYRLHWREQVDPAVPDRLFWRVRCAGTSRILARAPAAAGGWREAGMSVETPPSGCAAQWLELATDPGERRAPLTGWYAAFRLEPISSAGSAHARAAEEHPDRADADLDVQGE
jgi:hypothetical protein